MNAPAPIVDMIVPSNEKTIGDAARLIRSGQLVAFPTETVYGLGANALDETALKKIYALKGRPSTNPLIVHVASVEAVNEVADVSRHEFVHRLSREFWPGPLSLVLTRRASVPDIVSSGLPTVAVRIPNHPVALAFLREAGPVAAPSANRSNAVSPTTAQHVEHEFGEKLPLILDGGPCGIGIESTVISLVNPIPEILRLGSFTQEQIERCIGRSVRIGIANASGANLSPGMLAKHYSPNTPLRFADRVTAYEIENAKKVGVLRFLRPIEPAAQSIRLPCVERMLNPSGDLGEAAHNLYGMLRELDGMGLDLILVERCVAEGIGAAVLDRLERATK